MHRLTTSRLFLRPLRASDAVDVSALMTPAISQWLTNFATPFSVETAGSRIRHIIGAEAERRACVYAFERRSDAAFMGWFAVYLDATRSCGVLGYWLGEAYQGAGLMREGAHVALASAKQRLNVEAIEAHIHPANASSLALARSLGMEVVGKKSIYASARARDELCIHMAAR